MDLTLHGKLMAFSTDLQGRLLQYLTFNLMESVITCEMNLCPCLMGIILITLIDIRRSILIIDVAIPWAGNSALYRQKKEANKHTCINCFLFMTSHFKLLLCELK